jgi:hypothetical protein
MDGGDDTSMTIDMYREQRLLQDAKLLQEVVGILGNDVVANSAAPTRAPTPGPAPRPAAAGSTTRTPNDVGGPPSSLGLGKHSYLLLTMTGILWFFLPTLHIFNLWNVPLAGV